MIKLESFLDTCKRINVTYSHLPLQSHWDGCILAKSLVARFIVLEIEDEFEIVMKLDSKDLGG